MSIIAPIFQMSSAHAATKNVIITCDGTGGFTALSYASISQTVTVAQGDTLTISSLNSSYCDTLVLKDAPNPFNESLNINAPIAFTSVTNPPPAGVVNLTVSATATPGNYVLFIYQKEAGSSHAGIDWGEAIKVTVSSPAPTSANITYLAGAYGSGSAPSSPLTVVYGSTFTTPVNTFIPATGYTFAGWSDGTSVYAENVTYPVTGTVSGNVTLTATWRSSLVTITSLSPIRGSIKGGDEVTITGTGFNNAASVTVGGVAARVMRRTGSTKITIRTPAHAKGAVSIVVTNPDNGFATYNSFTYVVGDERGDHR